MVVPIIQQRAFAIWNVLTADVVFHCGLQQEELDKYMVENCLQVCSESAKSGCREFLS